MIPRCPAVAGAFLSGEEHMKYLPTREKNEALHRLLMYKPSLEEGEKGVEKDASDPMAWYWYGVALGNEKRGEEALEAFSRGIATSPFVAVNYFGRGRRNNAQGRYWAAMADFTTAIHLDYSNWLYWYYRATTQVTHGDLQEAVHDFEECTRLVPAEEMYPLVDWLYTTNAELGDVKACERALSLTDGKVDCPRMDWGYKRSVQLYKGIVSPEDFIDIPLMEREVLPTPDRVRLELNGLYYSLYWYWMVHGEKEHAKEAIAKLLEVGYPGAFAYSKALPIAKRLGLIKDETDNERST